VPDVPHFQVYAVAFASAERVGRRMPQVCHHSKHAGMIGRGFLLLHRAQHIRAQSNKSERLLMFSFVVVFLFAVAYCMLCLYVYMAHVKHKSRNNNKAKLNLTVRDEQRNKLEQMASLENRSVSNLIEVMADERWKRLAEQQGVAYAKTVAEAMNLKLDMDNPADREKLRRAVLDLVAGRKMPKQKGHG
jgi:hypothetical protein